MVASRTLFVVWVSPSRGLPWLAPQPLPRTLSSVVCLGPCSVSFPLTLLGSKEPKDTFVTLFRAGLGLCQLQEGEDARRGGTRLE